jgi:pimeloyl-ACP methyl ester carboxylesterase
MKMNSMQTQTIYEVADQAAATAREDYTIDSVLSKDGTRITYRKLGRGPGVVMLHGAMQSAQSNMQLAKGIADAFTVYLPERRGHNLGLPFVKDYNMQKEVEDLEALLAKTDTHNVFGVSAGGLICLQAARGLPLIHKVAVYEPALIVNGSTSTEFLARYDDEISKGKIAAALVSGMKGARLGPAVFNLMPRWLLELLTTISMKEEEKKAKPGEILMRDLAPTLHYDFCLVAEMAEKAKSFKDISPDVMLLGGSESPAWLKIALDALAETLPHAKRVEFPGLNHGGSSDLSSTNRSSKPEIVAEELRRFFAGSENS